MKGTSVWGTRAYKTIAENGMNGLVFLYPEGTLDDAKEMQDDWRVALAAKSAEWCQENYSSFVPVIGEWDVDKK